MPKFPEKKVTFRDLPDSGLTLLLTDTVLVDADKYYCLIAHGVNKSLIYCDTVDDIYELKTEVEKSLGHNVYIKRIEKNSIDSSVISSIYYKEASNEAQSVIIFL